MDKATVEAIKELLIDGLAKTENKILTEIESVRTEIKQIKNDMATKTEMNRRFNEVRADLTKIQSNFEVEVANEMLSDKQQMQQEIDFLKKRIVSLEKRLSGM